MSAPLGQLVVDLSLQSAAFQKGMADATRAFERFERQGKGMNQSLSVISGALGSIKAAAIGAAAAFASFSTLDKMIKASERVKALKGSFETLLGSSARASDMLKRVQDAANRLGAPVDSVAEATQKLSIGLTELGATNSQIAGVVENFIKLGRVGGTSMADINGALVQFGQALASGRLQGDELRSIMERMPQIGQLLAKEMGVSVNEIRRLGSEGKISAEVMANALLKASSDIDAAFVKLPRTSEQAYNTMVNKAEAAGAAISDAFGMSSVKIAGLDFIANALEGIKQIANDVARQVEEFGNAWERVPDARKAYTLAMGFTAIGTALAAIALSNPFTAILAGSTIAVTAILANWNSVTNFFENMLPAILQSVVVAFAGMAKGIMEIIRGLGRLVTTAFAEMLNPFIEGANLLGKAFKKDFGLTKLSGEFKLLDGVVKSVDDTIAEAGAKITDYTNKFEAGKKQIDNLAKSQQGLYGSSEKATESQRKLAESIKEGLDPASAMARKMEEVAQLQKLGVLTYQEAQAQMAKIREEYEKSAVGAGKAAKGAEDLDTRLKNLLLSLDPAAKAAADLESMMKTLDEALAADKLTWDEYAEAVNKAKEKIAGKDSIKDSLEEIKDAVNGFSRQFVDGIIDAAFEGKLSFDKLLTDMAKSITKFMANKMVQQLIEGLSGGKNGGGIFDSIIKGIGGIFGGGKAHGAAFNKGVEFFASGGIVGSPTAFGMSGGRFGVMGEAGPEAIIPLKRSASGDLGVRSSPVNITVNNNAPVDVAVAEKEDPNGMKQIEIMIDRRVSKGFSDGTYDKPLRGAFGLTRQGY